MISIFGILLVSKESKFLNWIVLVFGIIGLILAILKIIFPKAKFLMNYNEKAELNKKSFHEIYTDEGIFEFYSDGFYIDKLKNTELINWKNIKSIIAYKKDLITTDLIVAEIFTDEKVYNVNEETPGWFYFVDQINKTLNIKDKNWNINITQPAFATNLTLIYDSENRTLEDLAKEK